MNSSADPTRESSRPRRRKTSSRRFPMQAVVIGIIVGAGLGVALAQGILAFVYERREVKRQQEAAADSIAAEQLMNERQERRDLQLNSDWFRWATKNQSP